MKKIIIILFWSMVLGLVSLVYCENTIETPQKQEDMTITETQQVEAPKQEAEKYTLVYKFPKDKEIYYQMILDRKDDFNIAGKKFDVKKRTLLYISELFHGVDEQGNGLITVTYIQGWQGNIRIFSQSKEVKVKMSPRGEILESQGLQEIAAEFFKVLQYNLADYIPGIDRLPVKIDFSKMPSNTFNIYWQAFVFPVPEKPVAVGDIWEKRDKTVGITIQYKLQEVKEGRAYIDVFTEHNKGMLTGKAVFDIENGYLISNYVDMVTDATGAIVQRAAKEISGATGTEVKPASTLPEKTHMTFKMEYVPGGEQ